MRQCETHRAGIAQAVLLAAQHLPQDPPHDLAAARLGQVRDDVDGLWAGEGADALADLHDHLLLGGVGVGGGVLEGDEGVDGLAGQLVGDAHDGRLAHVGVLDQRRLDLRRRQPVARHVDHVVDAAPDPVVAVAVAARAVAGELWSGRVSRWGWRWGRRVQGSVRNSPCTR